MFVSISMTKPPNRVSFWNLPKKYSSCQVRDAETNAENRCQGNTATSVTPLCDTCRRPASSPSTVAVTLDAPSQRRSSSLAYHSSPIATTITQHEALKHPQYRTALRRRIGSQPWLPRQRPARARRSVPRARRQPAALLRKARRQYPRD